MRTIIMLKSLISQDIFAGDLGTFIAYINSIPTTNYYRRLVPGYEAPVCVAQRNGNRSALIRIPEHFRGAQSSNMKRIEFRGPDPSCNPYLAFYVILAAGIDGIKKKISIGDPIDEDIFKISPKRRKKLNIKQLPSSLLEATKSLEND